MVGSGKVGKRGLFGDVVVVEKKGFEEILF